MAAAVWRHRRAELLTSRSSSCGSSVSSASIAAPRRAASATPASASGGSSRRPRLRPAAEAAVIECRARTRVPIGLGVYPVAVRYPVAAAGRGRLPRSPGHMTYVPDESDSIGAPATGERAGSRRALGCAFEVVETLVLTLLIYLVIHNFVAQPFEVQQSSMVPTIVDGEYILIDKLTPRFDNYHYGDVIVFNPPDEGGTGDGIPFIKRTNGLPGEPVTPANGRAFVQRPRPTPDRL